MTHLIRPLADARGLSVSQVADGTLNRHVVADRQRLKQVLLNLLSSAIKYNRPGGSITIACQQSPTPGTGTSISVRDSGFGIPKDDLDRLSVPFDRLGAESGETAAQEEAEKVRLVDQANLLANSGTVGTGGLGPLAVRGCTGVLPSSVQGPPGVDVHRPLYDERDDCPACGHATSD